MIYRDRFGEEHESGADQEQVLQFLYQTKVGRRFLKILIQPNISKLGGQLLSTRLSSLAIGPFIQKNKIHLWEYEKKCIRDYHSYNEFFTRKIEAGNRPIDSNPQHLISVCDSKLSVYPITTDGTYRIKNTNYTLQSLLRSNSLAEHFKGGTLLLFRLTVDDYHRYCYPDDGTTSRYYHISGVFHTVNPLANDVYPIYKENTREYTVIKTANFGTIVMMEVGALMVGKIQNYKQSCLVKRGQEKGRFEFGGSTIVLCIQKDCVKIDSDIIKNSSLGIETAVKYGEKIGEKLFL